MEVNNDLIDKYLDGELDDNEANAFRAWLEADPKHVRQFARQVYVHQQLRETLLAADFDENLLRLAESESPAVDPRHKPLRAPFPYGIAIALLIGAMVGALSAVQIINRRDEPAPLIVNDPPKAGDRPQDGELDYVTTVVNATNCRWDATRSTGKFSLGSELRPGESLHLLEGIAEIKSTFDGAASTNFQLEGPLAMTLASDGIPSLLFGRLTASFAGDADRFALDTPLGRINVSGNASIGVIAAANSVEIHVFAGTATLDLWTIGVDAPSGQSTAAAGNSLHASVGADGDIVVERGKSSESGFVTPAAIAESQLAVSEEYVEAVRFARPVAYWRFENYVDGKFRNEASDRLHCRMVGSAVRWRPAKHGCTIEFGAAAGPGYLLTDDTFDDELKDGYSIEAWFKPLYFHHGLLFSLIDWTPSQSPLGRHRVALEICGPVSGFTSPYRPTDLAPGRLRFIHEVHRGFDAECYSPAPYAVRKWQHVVAVKNAESMQLYIDGEHVATQAATGTPESGLRVLMGQLLPLSPMIEDEVTSRLYGGELDEVAIYGRSLSDEDIQRHAALGAASGHIEADDDIN